MDQKALARIIVAFENIGREKQSCTGRKGVATGCVGIYVNDVHAAAAP
jgi:hypothetical protein